MALRGRPREPLTPSSTSRRRRPRLCREASATDCGRQRIDFEATIALAAVGRPSHFV
jgi:hypothetical protein